MSFLSDKLSKLASFGQSLALTKWYIDTLFDDGSILCVQIGEIALGGARLARVAADLFGVDGEHVSGTADALRIEHRVDGFSCARASVLGDRVKFQTDRLEADLTFGARSPSLVLRDPFLEESGKQIRWRIEVPDAEVTGALRVRGASRTLAGRGYRDRIEVEFTPWGLPLRMLRWGRAVAGPHAAVWVEATTPREVIACSWKDGVAGVRLPNNVCGPSRPLVVGAVIDLDNLNLGALAPIVRKITRDPYQEKRGGKALLDGHEGLAVEELVRFRA